MEQKIRSLFQSAWAEKAARLWLSILLCALIAAIDFTTPRGINTAILFTGLIYCGLWFPDPRACLIFAAATSILTAAGYFFKPANGVATWIIIYNRLVSMTVHWLVAVLLYRRRKAELETLAFVSIVNGSDDAIISKNLDGVIKSWNASAERVFGYSAREALGRNIRMLIPADLQNQEEDFIARIKRGESIEQYETQRRHKNGELVDVALTISPIRDSAGRLIGASKIARDISARKRADAAAREIERFSLAVQGTCVGWWDWNIATNDLAWSARFREMLGLADGEFQSHYEEFASRLHPEDRERTLNRLFAHLDHQGEYDVEYRLRAQNGAYVWIHAQGQAYWDPQGEPIRMVGSAEDISARKREEAKFRLLVHTVPHAVIVSDDKGVITLANRETQNMFGYADHELLGRPLEILLPERFRKAHPDHRRKYVHSPVALDPQMRAMSMKTELHALRKSGEEFKVEIGLAPLNVEGQQMFVSFVIDIAQRQHSRQFQDLLERQVAERTKELTLANNDLEAFAFVASHDLKAPLRVIQNAAKWLEQDLEPHFTDDTRDSMEMLRSRAVRMEKLLDDLLAYSRIGRKQNAKPPELVRGDILIEDVVTLASPPPGFTLRISPDFARLDLVRMPLQQILLNLVNNAIKHHDMTNGCINIGVEDQENQFILTVQDDGPGIEPQYHKIIFEMFKTLKRRDEVEGSGMGLAIVRKHVEIAGGRLELDSDAGRGCLFRVFWPKTAVFHDAVESATNKCEAIKGEAA